MPRPGWTEIEHFDVPEGQVFWWERFGVSWDVEHDGNMHFGAVIDQVPIGPGFGNFTHQPGDINFLDMCIVQQRIRGPARVAIEARISGVGDYVVYGRIFGFIGPDRKKARA